MNYIYCFFVFLFSLYPVYAMEDSVTRNPSDEFPHGHVKSVDPLLSAQAASSDAASIVIPKRIRDIDASIQGVLKIKDILEQNIENSTQKTKPIFIKSLEKYGRWIDDLNDLKEKALADSSFDVRSAMCRLDRKYDPAIFSPR
jgi:hypothetical protein